MWVTYFACYALALVVLIAPGALLLKSCSLSFSNAIACAAPLSVALYVVIGQLLWFMQLSVGGFFLFVVALVLSILVAFVSRGFSFRFTWRFSFDNVFEILLPTAALVAAFLLVVYSTVLPLDGPESFSQHSDNMAHLGSIVSMTETGYYSTFNASNYLATPVNQIPVEMSSSFYPEGWHIVCAIVSSSLGVSASMAENAVNLAFAGSVFPLGMFALSRLIFQGKNNLLLCCSVPVVSTCFVAFPSGMFLFGPLYPNAASYCALPALFFLFICVCNCIGGEKRELVRSVVVFVVSAVGVAVLQPNGIFTAVVMLTPYLVWKIRFILARFKATERASQGLPCVFVRFGIVCAVIAVWCCLYCMPAFKGVVTFPWAAFLSVKDAAISGIDLGLRFGAPQILLSVFVWVGFFWTFANRKHVWVSISFLVFLLMYVIGISTEGTLKTLLTGFWYNDHWRTSASLVFPAAILAAIGLNAIARAFLIMLNSGVISEKWGSGFQAGLSLLVVIAVAFPSFSINGQQVVTAFGQSRDSLEQLNILSESNSYSAADDAFVQQVLEAVGKDDLIINIPADGSISAYMKHGINCYFKTFGDRVKTDDCKEIVDNLYLYGSDDAVRSAVSNTDAKYVLMLDRNGFVRNGDTLWSMDGGMNESDWQGILRINDSTEGFDLVLSDGTRKLYRIVR